DEASSQWYIPPFLHIHPALDRPDKKDTHQIHFHSCISPNLAKNLNKMHRLWIKPVYAYALPYFYFFASIRNASLFLCNLSSKYSNDLSQLILLILSHESGLL